MITHNQHESQSQSKRGSSRLVYRLLVEKHNLHDLMSKHHPVVLPWQPVTQDAPHATPLPAASTITHIHSQTHYWWVFGSRFFLQQDLKSLFPPHKNRLGDKGPCLFFLFFLFSNPPPSLDFSTGGVEMSWRHWCPVTFLLLFLTQTSLNKSCPFYNRWCHFCPSLANRKYIWVVFRVDLDLLHSVEPWLQFINPHL